MSKPKADVVPKPAPVSVAMLRLPGAQVVPGPDGPVLVLHLCADGGPPEPVAVPLGDARAIFAAFAASLTPPPTSPIVVAGRTS